METGLGERTPRTVIDHRALLASAEAIDGLPITVARLSEIVADPNHNMRDIVEVVALDQALTATLLRRANSASLGGLTQIKTVRDAAVRLGSSALLSMALATSVSGQMKRALPAYGLAEGQLWRESVAASVAADVIRTQATADVPMEASTAALLHDFGKIALSRHFGPQILEMLEVAAQADDIDILDAETEVFGVNHADIGGMVAAHWKLPHSIVDAIVHHHEVTGLAPRGANAMINAAVALAHGMVPDVLARADALVSGESSVLADAPPGHAHRRLQAPPEEAFAELLTLLGMNPLQYPALVEAASKKYVELTDRYDVS